MNGHSRLSTKLCNSYLVIYQTYYSHVEAKSFIFAPTPKTFEVHTLFNNDCSHINRKKNKKIAYVYGEQEQPVVETSTRQS